MNITAIKTNTLQNLIRQYNDATTIAATADAAYQSYVNKADMYQNLYTQALANTNTVNAQWGMFLQLKSSLSSLSQTSDDCNLVADVSYNNIQKLVKCWEQVLQKTVEATDAINLASDFIVKRKASNPLISNDLVSDATTAAKNANTVFAQVLAALTATLNTLTSAGQAKKSTELTGLNIDISKAALLIPKPQTSLNEVKAATPIYTPLEKSLGDLLNSTTAKQTTVLAALNNANAEKAAAKEALDTANGRVASTLAALNSAKAAVAA
ncbi:MAG: hypothetical protein ACK5RG_06870 [Cyclobacteriaceae bacterium]|jgi:hypothetical protein|nr:hypothetical protein [Flammeovirgaceae bacterium]